MQLQAYLAREKLTYAAFGRLCEPELPRVTVRQYALALRFPRSKDVLRRIEQASGGAVTANDFVQAEGIAAE